MHKGMQNSSTFLNIYNSKSAIFLFIYEAALAK